MLQLIKIIYKYLTIKEITTINLPEAEKDIVLPENPKYSKSI